MHQGKQDHRAQLRNRTATWTLDIFPNNKGDKKKTLQNSYARGRSRSFTTSRV